MTIYEAAGLAVSVVAIAAGCWHARTMARREEALREHNDRLALYCLEARMMLDRVGVTIVRGPDGRLCARTGEGA
jgi:hypothetical protein